MIGELHAGHALAAFDIDDEPALDHRNIAGIGCGVIARIDHHLDMNAQTIEIAGRAIA